MASYSQTIVIELIRLEANGTLGKGLKKLLFEMFYFLAILKWWFFKRKALRELNGDWT